MWYKADAIKYVKLLKLSQISKICHKIIINMLVVIDK